MVIVLLKAGELLCMATWILLRVQLYPIMKNRFKQNQIQRKRTQNERLEEEIEDSDQGWFPNETTVRNINYSINPLATAFFNDPFSKLFGENIMIVLFCPAASARSPR
jgi:hypothetical protein